MLPRSISKSLFVFLLLLTPLATRGYYSPGKPSGFVNDYAQMLSAGEKQSLEAKLDNFEKETSNEIAAVTIESLQGDTIENFAVKLFEEWGIGKKDKDNGVLVLVAKDDRQMRIETGYGLEGALTDAQSFWITESIMKPAFRAGDFYAGIDGAVDKIIAATKGEYVPGDTGSKSGGVSNVFGWFWMIFFVLTFLSAILGRSRSWWAGGVVGGVIGVIVGLINGFLFMGLISLIVLIPLGLLFDFLVSRSYNRAKETGHYPWWFGGGGGFRGGGGFGGFGGGHSGGGGSSNSW